MRSGLRFRHQRASAYLYMGGLLLAILALACERPETVRVEIAGEPFELELALDNATRFRGMGGRSSVDDDEGMLFVYPEPRPLAVVMRDCPISLDVGFLSGDGRVLAVHTMEPEPPRRADETPYAYEKRLPLYPSDGLAQFFIETAGGRLAELGLRPGHRIELDPELAARSRR